MSWITTAWAIEIPSKTSDKVGVGCVVQVEAKQPVIFLDGKHYIFRDDGVLPDQVSSDGVFSVFVATSSEKKVAAQLLGDAGEILWSGDVPFPPKGQQTWLLIDEGLPGERPLVQVEFHPIASTIESQNHSQHQGWWMFWILPMLGFWFGWYVRRPKPTELVYWGKKTQNWDMGSTIHLVEDQEELLAVVERCAQGRLALLCTDFERLPLFSSIAEHQTMFVMNSSLPSEADSLHAELSKLKSLGEAVLIVDGLYGLVKPLPSESPFCVLEEILKRFSQDVCVLLMRDAIPDGVEIPTKQENNAK